MSDEAIDVGEALETLVHQFADPWSCLRELIQNAIDAGSEEIDVRIEHEPAEDPEDPGLLIVELVDTGEGMDRQIIDTRLTRLFSSAKDGDYTKIGRFGIGFVSVFALEPELVCVDTGRNGEFWRVLFKADRSFERIVLDHPIEGTTIRIYKRGDKADVALARERARRTLEYWCKHARVEIRLDDELISRPMEIEGQCLIAHQEDETALLLAYVEERAALRGYYHGGLTLHEERDDRLPHVAFKIDSRYLEHTLTRDNVIRDDNYEKAMAIVANLARTRLLERLLEACEQAAIERRFDAQAEFLRARLLEAMQAEGKPQVDLFGRPIIPTIGGEPVSLAEVRRQIRRCWQAPAPSPVTEHLRARGDLVLELPPTTVLGLCVMAHAGRAPSEVTSVCVPGPATPSERVPWERLQAAVLSVLRGLDLKVGDIALGHLAYPGSAVADHVAITQASFGELTRIEEIGELSSGWFRAGRVVVLNADHPTVVRLLELATSEAELAAYLLLKLFFLRSKLDPKLDGRLASLAAEARWQRLTS
ncbi:MAG: ATP-binding protein [Enhygromyxa sp.]